MPGKEGTNLLLYFFTVILSIVCRITPLCGCLIFCIRWNVINLYLISFKLSQGDEKRWAETPLLQSRLWRG